MKGLFGVLIGPLKTVIEILKSCGRRMVVIFKFARMLWLKNNSCFFFDVSDLMKFVNKKNARNLIKWHIQKIFDNFSMNGNKSYSLSEYITLDKKFQSFRGCCSFRQCMLNKSAKYGIKIFTLGDSVNYYLSNTEV